MVRQADRPTRDTIEVKVVVLGSPIQLVELEEGATKADALIAAGHSPDCVAKVNGVEVGDDDILEDGDRLTVSKKVKGN